MKKRIKLLVISILLLGGCMNSSKIQTTQEDNQVLLDYMSNKYNEEFEILSTKTSEWLEKDIEASVVAKNDEENNEINVHWQVKNNVDSFSDDYASLLYKFQVNAAMDDVVGKKFSEYNYVTYSELLDVQLSKYNGESFLDALKQTGMILKIHIIMDESALGKEEKIKASVLELYNTLKMEASDDVSLFIDVFVCENENFNDNKLYTKKYKEIYSISKEDVQFTYNRYDKTILKKYYISEQTKQVEVSDS